MTPPAESTGQRWLAPLFIVVLVLIGAGAGVWAGRVFLSPAPPGSGVGIAAEGDLAPEIWLRDVNGHPQSLSSLRGRPVLINFWATWCPPCVKELPLLADLHARRDSDGLAVLTIAQEDDAALVREFLSRHGEGLPTWMDPPSAGDASKPLATPATCCPTACCLTPTAACSSASPARSARKSCASGPHWHAATAEMQRWTGGRQQAGSCSGTACVGAGVLATAAPATVSSARLSWPSPAAAGSTHCRQGSAQSPVAAAGSRPGLPAQRRSRGR